MAHFDSKNNFAARNALNIAAITTNTTTNGVEIDTLGFGSLTFVIETGARTDGTITPVIQESDVSGSYSGSVSTDFLIGTTAAAALSAAQSRSTIGYVGKRRYVRLQLVSTAVTSGLTAGATAILGDAIHNPAS